MKFKKGAFKLGPLHNKNVVWDLFIKPPITIAFKHFTILTRSYPHDIWQDREVLPQGYRWGTVAQSDLLSVTQDFNG